LATEDLLRRAMSKPFEPTLGVPDVQVCQHSDDPVKNPSHPLSAEVLSQQDMSFQVLAIPDEHIYGWIVPEFCNSGV
jgi:hypothetical protein